MMAKRASSIKTGHPGHESCTFKVPDGGWGYAVLVGAAMISLLAPPIVGSFGILLYDIRKQMGVSVSNAAWIASITQALNFGSTPFVVIFASMFSFRKVAFFGGISISLGMFLTFFARRLEFLCITIGLLGGIGLGFSTKAGMFMVNLYFDKHRGFATGIYYAGGALSRLIFPIVVQLLLLEYGYRGTLMIWSGILAHICIAASLFQPVSNHRKHVAGPLCCYKFPVKVVVTNDDDDVNEVSKLFPKCFSDDDVPKSPASGRQTLMIESNNTVSNNVKEKCSSENGVVVLNENNRNAETFHRKESAASLASAYNIFQLGGNKDVYQKQRSSSSRGDTADEPTKPSSGRTAKLVLDYTLFKEPRFYAICCSGIFSSVANVNMFVFIPSMGRSKGLSAVNSAWLLSSVGIGEVIGRLVVPWLQDMHFIRAKYSFMAGAVVSAIVAAVLTMPESYTTMVVLCILLGVSAGSMTGLQSVINVETIGLERLPSSVGFTQFLQGVFALPAGPILGAIRDSTGDYVRCFYLMSAIYTCAFLTWLTETILTRRAFSTKQKATDIVE